MSHTSRLALPLAISALSCLAIPAAASAACADANGSPDVLGPQRTSKVTLCLVNEQRTRRGLRALTPNSKLEKAARGYATSMVRHRFFDHNSPSGSTPLERIRATGYLAQRGSRWTVGENLAWATGYLATPKRIVDSWMTSSGHRHNILNKSFREVGFGVAIGAPIAGAGRDAGTYASSFGYRGK